MDILVVDPEGAIAPAVEAAFRSRGWRCAVTSDRSSAFAATLETVPDAVVIQGDGEGGESTHLCQRFKQNPLTAGVPIILVETESPPDWLLVGTPADAFTQSPFEPAELVHHLDVLVPAAPAKADVDDLTVFPRRRAIVAEMSRRLAAREPFAVGLLSFREAETYRQDYGRVGTDQYVVLVSTILRRHTTADDPISVGYLDDGVFLVLGAPSIVHHLVAIAIREFERLAPAYREVDTLFGPIDREREPPTGGQLEGAVCLVEPDRLENALQVGHLLAEAMVRGREAIRPAQIGTHLPEPVALVAD